MSCDVYTHDTITTIDITTISIYPYPGFYTLSLGFLIITATVYSFAYMFIMFPLSQAPHQGRKHTWFLLYCTPTWHNAWHK